MAKQPVKKSKKRKRLMKLQHRARLLVLFGQKLQQLREAKGFTPAAFCAASGIDSGNLAKYEGGFREPGLVIIEIMAKTLGVKSWELLDFEFDFDLAK